MSGPAPKSTETRSLALLVCLLLLLALHPFLSGGVTARLVLNALFVLILCVGTWTLDAVPRQRLRAFVLGGLATLALLPQLFADPATLPTWLALAFPVCVLVFLLDVAVALLGFVIDRRGSPRARLYSALSVYLLMGVMFAMAYVALHLHDPAALSFGANPLDDGHPTARFIYFSFVTLTTLGYGDIQPMSGPARALAVVEAVAGVLYVAIMIASLVSAIPAERDADS